MSEKCPKCGGRVTKASFNRHGWYYADCGRRHHWERAEWESYEPEECLRRQLNEAKERIGELEKFAEDIRDGFDCDADAHRYGIPCRKCRAGALLAAARREPTLAKKSALTATGSCF